MVNPTPEQKPLESSVANSKVQSHADLIAAGVRKRIPLSTAQRKMEVPAIDGYYLYWFKEANVTRAMEAGYEFVDRTEVTLVNAGLATDHSVSGNTDLGTRVSMVGSAEGGIDGGSERAYLMKLRQEWRNEDRAAIDARNAAILSGIFKDEMIFGQEGSTRSKDNLEYVRTAEANLPLFNRKTRKAKIVR
jgi:hypothetical protein